MKFAGRDFKVGHWDGTTFTPIGGEKSSSLSIGNESVDTSSKSTGQWRELANCGGRTLDVSLDGFVTDHATYSAMLTRSMAGSIDRYKVVSGNGDSLDFYAQVQAHERSGDHNGAEAYALSLVSTSVPVYANGYCRQTYTSTWNGSAWGAAVSSGPATCSATFPDGANVWVKNTLLTQEYALTPVFPFLTTGDPGYPNAPSYYPASIIIGPFAFDVEIFSGNIAQTANTEAWGDDQIRINGVNKSPGNNVKVPMGTLMHTLIAGNSALLQLYNSVNPSTYAVGYVYVRQKFYAATATFTNALGIGDFDCVVGGAACATIPALPNGLPPPDVTFWKLTWTNCDNVSGFNLFTATTTLRLNTSATVGTRPCVPGDSYEIELSGVGTGAYEYRAAVTTEAWSSPAAACAAYAGDPAFYGVYSSISVRVCP